GKDAFYRGEIAREIVRSISIDGQSARDVAVKLGMSEGKLALEVHSNQLRGDTYNGGFLDIGMIENPRLTLTPVGGGPPVTVVVERSIVGGKGTFTPLRQLHVVPPGTYDIDFEAAVYPPVKLGVWPVDFTTRKPIKVRLATGHTLGR
ncbi:MAG TPA: hypothetical protein PK264_16865, partial [Hyphomicrobiaceae bacterium]|nr:hypothetical protein [Hyphomicrobiaceae bacterium]